MSQNFSEFLALKIFPWTEIQTKTEIGKITSWFCCTANFIACFYHLSAFSWIIGKSLNREILSNTFNLIFTKLARSTLIFSKLCAAKLSCHASLTGASWKIIIARGTLRFLQLNSSIYLVSKVMLFLFKFKNSKADYTLSIFFGGFHTLT